MIKDIKYTGLSANPSDHESSDGDLTTALNLIPEDGQLKPLFQPKEVCTLPNGCKFVYIHKTATFTHYIAFDEATHKLYWIDKEDATGTILINELSEARDDYHLLIFIKSFSSTIFQYNAIGNTLLVLTNEGVNYFLWKDGQYKYIGNHIPELPLSFGLQGTPEISTEFDVGSGFTPANYLHVPTSETPRVILPYNSVSNLDSAINTMTNNILAKVNKFIKEKSVDAGKFIMPFFVCYAFRLYDGSLTMHSAPVLMIPNSGCAPNVIISSSQTNGSFYTELKAKIGAVACDLDYACIDSDAFDALQNWNDIVKSVDIFISAPIYTYDQSEGKRIQGFEYSESFPEYTISFSNGAVGSVTVNNGSLSTGGSAPLRYCKHRVSTQLISSDFHYRFILPTRDEEDVMNNIRECCNFYLLKSIKLDDVFCQENDTSFVVNLTYANIDGTPTNQRIPKSSRPIIEIDEDYLDALTTKEEMKMAEDLNSHDVIVASFSYVYNQRLNLANMSKKVDMPFNPAVFVPYTQPAGSRNLSQDTLSVEIVYNTNSQNTHTTDIFMKFVQDAKEIVCKSPTCKVLDADAPFVFFYIPNTSATKAFIDKERYKHTITETGTVVRERKVITLPLQTHTNLNGAFFFDGWEPNHSQTGWIETDDFPSGTIPNVTTDNNIPLPNKLYTSELNNPFLFPAKSIVTVGTGTIVGMCSAAKALSQGQFGQFPLYAFTTDGVWALEVAIDGTFSARQPITRDVCTNPDSITQLDSAVLFATDRGLMLISGSESTCITDSIATEHPFNVLQLSHASDLHAMLGHTADTCLPTQPFLAFLNGCRMIYDYIHQHLILYNNSYSYSYIYSLKSKLWGMMYSNLHSSLNSYPDALAMDNNNHLVSFSDTNQSICKGLIFTRPLKLGEADILKSIHTIIQRGMFQRGDVNTVLYGSHDLYSWHIIASSINHEIRNLRGTPYKYFRIASVVSFSPDKSISGVTIDVEQRHTTVIH